MKRLLILLAAITVTTGVMADTKPFNISITPGISIFDRSTRIEGITLSIWGENPQLSLALGIVNGTTGNSAGLDWAWILNYADNFKGVRWALANYGKQDIMGWDGGFVNYLPGTATGLETGGVNYANRFKGVQFGFFNFVDTTDTGVQIGIINIIRSNKSWFSDLPNSLAPVMIFVNWSL